MLKYLLIILVSCIVLGIKCELEQTDKNSDNIRENQKDEDWEDEFIEFVQTIMDDVGDEENEIVGGYDGEYFWKNLMDEENDRDEGNCRKEENNENIQGCESYNKDDHNDETNEADESNGDKETNDFKEDNDADENNDEEEDKEEDYNDDYNDFDENLGDNPDFGYTRNLDYSCKISDSFGYCMTPVECKNRQGVNLEGNALSSAQCGKVGKICCQPRVTCGNSTKSYVSLFTPGGNNLRAMSGCNLLVNAADESICQIRIDFVSVKLSKPTTTNLTGPTQCNLDSIVISGSSNKIPTLCSTLVGEHIYAHINQSEAQTGIFIKINLATRLTTTSDVIINPDFKIRIRQLQCPTLKANKAGTAYNRYRCAIEDFNLLAPPGCLQYYTEPTGEIKSLGLDTSVEFSSNQLLSYLNYAICFKKFQKSQCIKFYVNNFLMGFGNCSKKLTCTEMLQGFPVSMKVPNMELCGSVTANTELFCPGENPFVLKVRTDGKTDMFSNGFYMGYENPPYICPNVNLATTSSGENGSTGSTNSSTGSNNTVTGSTNSSTGSTNSSTSSNNSSTGSNNSITGSNNSITGSTNIVNGSTNSSTSSTNGETGSTNSSTGSTNSSTDSTNSSTGSTNSSTGIMSQVVLL